MKIAFFTEGRYYGKVDRNNPNMRTDLTWIHLLDADHYYMYEFSESIKYDIGIIIVPKNKIDVPFEKIKKLCNKVAIMQEGPCNYWADYSLPNQIQYLSLIKQADFILCHNESDLKYYKGLVNRVYIMPSVMVEDGLNLMQIKPLTHRSGVIIGGNMCAWYGGMVSYLVAKNYKQPIYAPSMGRKVAGEEQISDLKHLPYMNWRDWIHNLSGFKIGVHMMPTVAAGTFSLNCGYLGIPCIGNIKVDTQRILFPDLSVDVDDIESAVNKITILKNDSLHHHISEQSKEIYDRYFHCRHFAPRMKSIFTEQLDNL